MFVITTHDWKRKSDDADLHSMPQFTNMRQPHLPQNSSHNLSLVEDHSNDDHKMFALNMTPHLHLWSHQCSHVSVTLLRNCAKPTDRPLVARKTTVVETHQLKWCVYSGKVVAQFEWLWWHSMIRTRIKLTWWMCQWLNMCRKNTFHFSWRFVCHKIIAIAHTRWPFRWQCPLLWQWRVANRKALVHCTPAHTSLTFKPCTRTDSHRQAIPLRDDVISPFPPPNKHTDMFDMFPCDANVAEKRACWLNYQTDKTRTPKCGNVSTTQPHTRTKQAHQHEKKTLEFTTKSTRK